QLIQSLFFINHTPTSDIYTLSLHDALPIFDSSASAGQRHPRYSERLRVDGVPEKLEPWIHPILEFHSPARTPLELHGPGRLRCRSEEHTSELQSRGHLVCRLLLEKKKRQHK